MDVNTSLAFLLFDLQEQVRCAQKSDLNKMFSISKYNIRWIQNQLWTADTMKIERIICTFQSPQVSIQHFFVNTTNIWLTQINKSFLLKKKKRRQNNIIEDCGIVSGSSFWHSFSSCQRNKILELFIFIILLGCWFGKVFQLFMSCWYMRALLWDVMFAFEDLDFKASSNITLPYSTL